MAATMRVNLGYSLHHFLNFQEQLASRLQDHSTTGNVVCHLIAAPLLGVASFSLVQLALGDMTALICSSAMVIWCLVNDTTYGFPYAIFSIITSLYQLYFTDPEIYQILLIYGVAILIQVGIGHAYFERRPPNELEGIVKGTGSLFGVLDFLCELLPAVFHFYTIALLKLGFRPELSNQVQKELKRINTLISSSTG